MGEIYEKMDNMLGTIKDIMVDNAYSHHYDDVEKIVLARWEKMAIPLQCLGFALSPGFMMPIIFHNQHLVESVEKHQI